MMYEMMYKMSDIKGIPFYRKITEKIDIKYKLMYTLYIYVYDFVYYLSVGGIVWVTLHMVV